MCAVILRSSHAARAHVLVIIAIAVIEDHVGSHLVLHVSQWDSGARLLHVEKIFDKKQATKKTELTADVLYAHCAVRFAVFSLSVGV